MKRFIFQCMLAALIAATAQAQQASHLIIVTTDGLRWQEVFGGMDVRLAAGKNFNQGDSATLFKNYGQPDTATRRKSLLPFLWNTMATKGQLYGNRRHGSIVNTANRYWFSYPGYNEIFTGYPDTLINSNDYRANPHVTVLEYLNQQSQFKGKVAAFTAWDAFSRILNEARSGIPVQAAFDTTSGKNLSPEQRLLNRMLAQSYKPWGRAECLDVFTHAAAMDYLKNATPKVLYIAYGETDEWAHAGQYRDYLNAAHQVDTWLQEIWTFVQATPPYKNNTTLLVTVDHGRGRGNDWTSHGADVPGADEIWFAVIGPGIKAKGDVAGGPQVYQQQLAQTIANLLGVTYKAAHRVAAGLLPLLK